MVETIKAVLMILGSAVLALAMVSVVLSMLAVVSLILCWVISQYCKWRQ